MHLVFLTRGIKQQIDLWAMFMQSQMFNWRRKPLIKQPDGTYKHGEWELTKVQGSLRPIQLWEYVFPEESLQEVLAMMHKNKDYDDPAPEAKKLSWILRRGMHLNKIPDMPELKTKEPWQITQKFIPVLGMGIHLMGMREDQKRDFPEFGYYQEGL